MRRCIIRTPIRMECKGCAGIQNIMFIFVSHTVCTHVTSELPEQAVFTNPQSFSDSVKVLSLVPNALDHLTMLL